MSILEKPLSSQSSPSTGSSPLSSIAAQDVESLLKDLNEKKQSFRRKVVSLAAELKEIRDRFASHGTLTRQEAESKANNMELEVGVLQKELEERNEQLLASASLVKCPKELDDLRTQLSATRESADASAASAPSAQLHCFELVKELDEKNNSLVKHEESVARLEEQLDNLKNDLLARESSQKRLKDEVMRIEHDIMEALAKAEEIKECELREILDEVSTKNFENIKKLLVVKDEEIAKLKDEITILSDHWRPKTEELESKTQLEKQRHTDQELKKRVLKLEFCLLQARSQTRKLKRIEERRDKAIKELRDQIAAKQQSRVVVSEKQSNFWETPGFKIVVSMSMLILGVFSKR